MVSTRLQSRSRFENVYLSPPQDADAVELAGEARPVVVPNFPIPFQLSNDLVDVRSRDNDVFVAAQEHSSTS